MSKSNLQLAETYGEKAHAKGINIIAADKEFMADFCSRKVGEAMPHMKAWKKGWENAYKASLAQRFNIQTA